MKDNSFFEKLTDTMLDEAAKIACDGVDESISAPDEEIQFSAEHEKKMKKLFKQANQPELVSRFLKYGKRVACIALVFVCLSGVAIFSVDAWRTRFFNFFIDEGKPNTDFSFQGTITNRYADDNISLGYVPNGMECVISESTDSTVSVSFSNELGNYFTLYICDKDTSMSVDTENGVVENIMINNAEAVYISTAIANSVIWYRGEYLYNLSGNIQRDVLLKIAENINQ